MLSPQQIAGVITDRFAGRVEAVMVEDKHPRIHVGPEVWPELAAFLKSEPALQFDWLGCLTGLDYAADAKMAVAYDLWSFSLKHRFAVKVYVPRDSPAVPSVTSVWKSAGWHDREAYDLFGIDFPGHPDLRRILLEDDWVGHPLRKDYVFPREVHGIPGSVELDWQQKPD